MSVAIPETHVDLVEKPLVASLATAMPDGQPQTTLIWFEFDGAKVLFTTGRGTQKEKNILLDPRVSLLARDPDNPYRYLEIRGTVESINEAGAMEQLNQLAQRYTGHPMFTETDIFLSLSELIKP
jgi:PPOX class probable F420-dependent enzyme